MKLIILVMLLTLFSFNLNFTSCIKKFNNIGDIPKFCTDVLPSTNLNRARTIKTGFNTPLYNNTKNNSIELEKNNANATTPFNIKIISINKEIQPNIFLSKLIKCLLGLYFYLIFLSLLKMNNDFYKTIHEHLCSRYSHFEDLTKLMVVDSSKYESKHVFINGLVFFEEPAVDPIFKFDYGRAFMKIIRTVEVYDFENKIWKYSSFLSEENITNLCSRFGIPEDELYNILNYFKNEVFIGKGSIRGIELSEQQLKKLENYETIKLNNDVCQEVVGFMLSNLKAQFKLGFSSSEILIYIKDLNTENWVKVFKISLRGYRGEYISVMAKIKSNTFQTIHLPQLDLSDNLLNKTEEINVEPKYNVEVEFSMHPFNFIFCCCFNDSPSFKPIEDEEKNTTHINWFIDRLITKEEFLKEKHHIFPFKQNIYRIILILLIFGNFYIFPQTLYFIATIIIFPKILFWNEFLLLNSLVTSLSVVCIIIYSNLGWVKKGICIGILMLFLFSYLIFYITVIILLNK